jgi:hypothetical protein
MAQPRLRYTKHAEDMLVERGIDRKWVEATVTSPDFTETDPGQLNIIRAFRKIAERDNKTLRVAYTIDEDVFKIITAFFDRGRSSPR